MVLVSALSLSLVSTATTHLLSGLATFGLSAALTRSSRSLFSLRNLFLSCFCVRPGKSVSIIVKSVPHCCRPFGSVVAADGSGVGQWMATVVKGGAIVACYAGGDDSPPRGSRAPPVCTL